MDVTRSTAAAAFLALVASMGSACGGDGGPATVRVAAAASLTEVVDALADRLADADDPLVVEADVGGSSALALQILEGLPADVFLAADSLTMARVVDAGLAGGVRRFAGNRLAIVVPAGAGEDVAGLEAFGDPELLLGRCSEEVPCGRLAVAELAESGITDRTDTEEPDVRTLLAKVVDGALDAALVYRTDAISAGDDVEVVADERLDQMTTYQAAPLESGDADAAERFLRALFGADGRRALRDHGFDVVADDASG